MARKINSTRLIIILVSLALVLIVFSLIAKKQGWVGRGSVIEIETGTVDRGVIIEKVSASGKVQPEVELKISPDVSGEIIELNIQEGDSVKKGDLLIRIRPDIFLNQLDQAKANANNARANLSQMKANLSRARARLELSQFNYDRSKKLFEQKAISESEFEQADTDLKVSKEELEAQIQNVKAAEYGLQNSLAAVRVAEDNVGFTKIFAPEGGIISKLSVEQGERVVGTSQMQGTEMLRIANLNNMEVRVDVNENDIIRVNLQDTVEIEVDAYANDDEKFLGIVTSIANSPNDESFSTETITEFEVKISILNESYKHLISKQRKYPFKPGMTASVEILTETKKNALKVPLSAVTVKTDSELEKENKRGRRGRGDETESSSKEKDEELFEVVFIHDIENEQATARKVKTGISDFDNIEVLEGLKEGEVIIIGPYLAISKRLKNESAVEVKKEESKSGWGPRNKDD